MEDSRVRIADLLRFPRPLTAASSLPFPSTSSQLPPPPPRSTSSRFVTALTRPTVLIGILTLPTHSPSPSPPCSCLRFSDASATLCCDLLHFRAAAIGKEIRVTAWNFIPFKHPKHELSHGFLEIIDWRFSDPNEGLNPVDSLPLVPNRHTDSCVDGLRSVHGVVESVGPVSVVPCTMAVNSSDLNSGPKVNLPGFLVQIISCQCRLCGSKEMLIDKLNDNRNVHSFTKLEIVYFCGDASSWHPAITKLIGIPVVVLGLKKKIIYMTKEESRVMYVTTDKSVLQVGSCSEKCVPNLKTEIKGNGECGAYTGVIKGVYMQGMALELDHDVWLLLTDQLHTSIHGLRVGSIISVRNVHFVNPKFSWTKVIILGACVKTSIIVHSFSPLETACNVVLQSTGMLGKFIQSLPFSARLWVLLLVSSFRKKFAGFLSDKEILGSKHKEGLAQMYASSLLPLSVFQTQHGAFTGLCTHNLNGCGRELHCGFLKLVIPISVFICHCLCTLLRTLKLENQCKLLPIGNHFSILSREARYNGRSVRRIIRSEDINVVLLGYLKIDPSTRKLRLVDATGGVDILIPDLPLTWNPNEIYEVTSYDVFVDSIGELVDQFELFGSESLSCRTIFNCTQAERELSTSIFVYCPWKNAKCRKFPLYSSINDKNETETLEPGSYHLLRVSHKFPPQEKYSNKMGSSKSSTFVEAILLPCILLLSGKSIIAHSCNASTAKTKELSKYCISCNNEDEVPIKKQKLIKESVNSLKDEFHTSIYELRACSNSFWKSEENKCIDLKISQDTSCLATFRNLQNVNVACPAILRSTSPMKDMSFNSKCTSRKILLEFSSDRFLKYQLLQIGGYYIIDHNRKDCFSCTKDTGFDSSGTGTAKFLVDSGKHIWSLSFIYDENLSDYKSVYTFAKDSLSPTVDEVFPKEGIEQLLLRSNDELSDVCLYLPVNLAGVLGDNIMESEDSQSQQFATSEDSANISLSTGTVVARPNFCFGSHRSNCLFPEGNLISLEGNVVDVHDIGSSFCNSCSSGANLNALQLKGLIRTRSSFCIHVLVHHHIVDIFGSVNKHAFPTGFGPGATAKFHRILDARAQNKFVLLPVSFIVIKLIKVRNKESSDRSFYLKPSKDGYNTSQDSFSCLISQLSQSLTHNPIVLRCRVVAVFVLVIERKTTNFIADINAKETLLDIPLACFLLEDGSSSCCCWANAERAAALLRLHEEVTTSYHLGRLLKKHERVTVKNHGLCIDYPYQDLVVSVTSGNALCSSDENLLKSIIFNACVGRIWNVVANGIDAEERRRLETEYLTEMVNVQTMQNIWAKEVSCPRTLAVARNMIQELLKS
ncbi:hypothetical protein VNO77_39096 [Canavalia gladiata]|uniref:CST complex subunit CTC1 n=1 Tax=Canavalia gladiata TaxID=3824 RepID=A0AAN9PXG3_CANGL